MMYSAETKESRQQLLHAETSETTAHALSIEDHSLRQPNGNQRDSPCTKEKRC